MYDWTDTFPARGRVFPLKHALAVNGVHVKKLHFSADGSLSTRDLPKRVKCLKKVHAAEIPDPNASGCSDHPSTARVEHQLVVSDKYIGSFFGGDDFQMAGDTERLVRDLERKKKGG